MEEEIQQNTLSSHDALQMICKFFQKEWTTTTESDIDIRLLKGGHKNCVYVVENRRISGSSDEPRKVILRTYSHPKQDLSHEYPIASEVEEALVFQQQSKNGNGPKLYGILPVMRLEEYIPSHTLSYKEVDEPVIITDLAKQFARFHHQDPLPFTKTRLDVIFKLKPYDKKVLTKPLVMKSGFDFSIIDKIDLSQDMELMRKLFKEIGSKEVLLHVDTNFLNILIREEGPSPVNGLKSVIIDYEMVGYGPRLFDIGSFFFYHMVNENGVESKCSGHPYPSEDQRRLFVKEYLSEIRRNHPRNFDPHTDNSEHLLMESDVGSLLYALHTLNCMLPQVEGFAEEPGMFPFLHHVAMFYLEKRQEVMKKVMNNYPHLFTD